MLNDGPRIRDSLAVGSVREFRGADVQGIEDRLLTFIEFRELEDCSLIGGAAQQTDTT